MTLPINRRHICASCRRNLAFAQLPLRQSAPAQRHQRQSLSTQAASQAEKDDEQDTTSSQSPTKAQAQAQAQARRIVHRPLASKTAPDPAAKRNHPIPSALFLASLGNPGKEYALTRHSAGHILLDAIRSYVGAPPLQGRRTSSHTELPIVLREASPQQHTPPSQHGTRRARGEHGLESNFDAQLRRQDAAKTQMRAAAIAARAAPSRPVCFFQSPSFMNTGGPGVVREFLSFASLAAMPDGRGHGDAGEPAHTAALAAYLSGQSERADVRFAYHVAHPALVVLHDELETPLGVAALKNAAGLSTRGHNGLKSIETVQGQLKNVPYVRVGIGIGPRPQSRDPEEVARFVLQRMSERQVESIQRLAGPVWEKLNQVIGSLIPGKPVRVDMHTT